MFLKSGIETVYSSGLRGLRSIFDTVKYKPRSVVAPQWTILFRIVPMAAICANGRFSLFFFSGCFVASRNPLIVTLASSLRTPLKRTPALRFESPLTSRSKKRRAASARAKAWINRPKWYQYSWYGSSKAPTMAPRPSFCSPSGM